VVHIEEHGEAVREAFEQGLTLVHISAQPEPFYVLGPFRVRFVTSHYTPSTLLHASVGAFGTTRRSPTARCGRPVLGRAFWAGLVGAAPNVFHKQCLLSAEKWTSVSPCRRAAWGKTQTGCRGR
jgi:hypothetical protein